MRIVEKIEVIDSAGCDNAVLIKDDHNATRGWVAKSAVAFL